MIAFEITDAASHHHVPAAAVPVLYSTLSRELNVKVVIIGAGMGGMSAAIALRQIGIDTEVYERVTENKPVGAAISVWSNGVKCLNYLGLQEETAQLGGIVETMSYVEAHTGQTMCRSPLQPLIDEVGQRPYTDRPRRTAVDADAGLRHG